MRKKTEAGVVADHAKVPNEVKEVPAASEQPWLALAGSLGEEEGRELARTIRDAFGRDEIEVERRLVKRKPMKGRRTGSLS